MEGVLPSGFMGRSTAHDVGCVGGVLAVVVVAGRLTETTVDQSTGPPLIVTLVEPFA